MNNHVLLVAYGAGRLGRLDGYKIIDEVEVFEDKPDEIISIHVPKIPGRRNIAFITHKSGALSVVCLHTMIFLSKWTEVKMENAFPL